MGSGCHGPSVPSARMAASRDSIGGELPLNPLDLPHQKLPTRLVLSGRQGERPPVGGELDGQLGQLLFEPAALSYVPLPLWRRAQVNAAP